MSRMLERLQDRVWARRWRRQQDRAHAAWMASPKRAQILACQHANRRANPAFSRPEWKGEICNDCGVGIVTPPRSAS